MSPVEKKFPSIELLRKLVRYEPGTGKLFWLERTPDIFPSPYARNPFNTKHAGKEVAKRNLGYVVVAIRVGGASYEMRGHRVAWALHTGAWAEDEIDHRNGVRDDNRFDNLRVATHGQNNQNKSVPENNKSGFKGVHFHKQAGKWRAQIRAGKVLKDLGLYSSPELAGAAYLAASKLLHGEFSKT